MSLCIPPNHGKPHGVAKTDTLPDRICTEIIGLHNRKHNEYVAGKVYTEDGKLSNVVTIRQVDTWRIHEKEDWLDTLLIELVVKANVNFDYNLSGLLERPQLLRYKTPSIGYEWHSDTGQGDASTRKISCSILLNNNFKGGNLEFFLNGKQVCPMNKGDSIFFSSFISHRVTKITEGERWALVAWFSGPPFR
jgi:predicted 2-oxoglutarate/Fe(II)-dependent dioxygenase YbiX